MIVGGVTTQTARKQHTCFWCGEKIEPAQQYVRWVWKDGRVLTAIKTHPECRKAWGTLDYDDRDSVFPGEQCRGCTCERGYCKCDKRGER